MTKTKQVGAFGDIISADDKSASMDNGLNLGRSSTPHTTNSLLKTNLFNHPVNLATSPPPTATLPAQPQPLDFTGRKAIS
jgi:hypothetical protein